MARTKQRSPGKRVGVLRKGVKKATRQQVAAVSRDKAPGGPPKRRWRPGTVALREIRKYQKSTGLLLQRAPFQRIVREIMQIGYEEKYRWTSEALHCLQEAAEAAIVGLMADAVLLMAHRGAVTLKPKDLFLTLELTRNPYFWRGDSWLPGSRFPLIATQRPPDASVAAVKAGQPKAANAPGKERPQEAAPVVVGSPAAEERSQVAAPDVDLSPSSLREMEAARERIRESREMHNELRRLSATSITF